MNESIFSLAGKNIIVTGSCGLLGNQHVRAILEAGGNPVLADLSTDRIEQQRKDLTAQYARDIVGVALDITKEEDVAEACLRLSGDLGAIHGLVNNAANNPKVETAADKDFSRLENFPLTVWDDDLNVGLKGSLLCIKHFGYQISKSGTGGSIVNVSSDLGLISPDQRLYSKPGLGAGMQPVKPVTYSVVKSGLIGMTRYVSTYWASENVRCNAICPGGVENGQDPDFLKRVSALIPLGRLATKEEYKGLLVFLLSDASSYINGAIIAADGGRTAW